MKRRSLKFVFSLLICLVPLLGSSQTSLPSEGCRIVWKNEVASEFSKQLLDATGSHLKVWDTYRLGDGAVVLDAGLTKDSLHCLALFQRGELLEYHETQSAPRLATPLYGYYLNFTEISQNEENPLLKVSQQPEEIGNWLTSKGLQTTVLMPVEFPQFPFEIPTLKKVQIAIHESFHVEVMLRNWFTKKGTWPDWDSQTDRTASRQCYGSTEEEKGIFRNEQLMLSGTITALLSKDFEKACEMGESYLTMRKNRQSKFQNLEIIKENGEKCGCEEAEIIMELEEGIADYASWTALFYLNISSQEELIKRYEAIQNEPFYLTGAMLLHAIAIMDGGDISKAISEMVTAKSAKEGALVALFESRLEKLCK